MDSLSIIPKLHIGAKWSRRDNGEYFLYNDELDSQMTISESALLVIECINGVNTIKEITDKLTGSNSKEEDYKNISRFICQDLKDNNILDDSGTAKSKKIKFNKILLSGKVISPICNLLTFLFKINVIVSLYLFLTGIIAYSLFQKNIPTGYSSTWYVFGIGVLILTLAHELGHCTALRFCGLKSKGIGVGIHFVFPMVFAEVTQAWVLSPKKRMIVDLGGFHFQLIVTLLLFIIAIQWDSSSAMNLVRFSIFLFFFNLNPFIKSDVYWAISDYFNIPNLYDAANNKISLFFKEPKLSNISFLFAFGILRYIFLVLVLGIMFFYVYKSLYALYNGIYEFNFTNIKNDLIIIISLIIFLFAIFNKYKRSQIM